MNQKVDVNIALLGVNTIYLRLLKVYDYDRTGLAVV